MWVDALSVPMLFHSGDGWNGVLSTRQIGVYQRRWMKEVA